MLLARLLALLPPLLVSLGLGQPVGGVETRVGAGESDEDKGTSYSSSYISEKLTAPTLVFFTINSLCSEAEEGPFVYVGTSENCQLTEEEKREGASYSLWGCKISDTGYPQVSSWSVAVNAGECFYVHVNGDESGEGQMTNSISYELEFKEVPHDSCKTGDRTCRVVSSYLYEEELTAPAQSSPQAKAHSPLTPHEDGEDTEDDTWTYKTLISYYQRGYTHITLDTNGTDSALGVALGCSFEKTPEAVLSKNKESSTSAYMFIDSNSEDNCLLLTFYPKNPTPSDKEVESSSLDIRQLEIRPKDEKEQENNNNTNTNNDDDDDENNRTNSEGKAKVHVEFIPVPLNTFRRTMTYSETDGEFRNAFQGALSWEAHEFRLERTGTISLYLEKTSLGPDGVLLYKENTCKPGYMGTPKVLRQKDIDKMEESTIKVRVANENYPCLEMWFVSDQTTDLVVRGTYSMKIDKTFQIRMWLYLVFATLFVFVCILVGIFISKRRRMRRTMMELGPDGGNGGEGH